MGGAILNRLEIDVMQANELAEASELAAKHKIPALVVHPDLASEAQIYRGRAGGRYFLITPIDWPKGEIFGQNKLRGLSTDALDADGFEILLTGGKNKIDSRNEAKALTEFIKTHLAESLEVRFVLGVNGRDDDNIKALCEALLDVRTPAYVRTDIQLKLQVSKANPDIHNKIMETIRSIVKVPIKLSGNINNVRTITSCNDAARFAVNLLQAKNVVKELQQQPEELRRLLGNENDTTQ
jgi:deoxyribose-phosphate aldolase